MRDFAGLPIIGSVRRAIGAAGPFTGNLAPYESPQFRDGVFQNRMPSRLLDSGERRSMLMDVARKGKRGRPAKPVPLGRPDLPKDASDLGATWLGHTTVLLELSGHWVLIDPVWSDRVSPAAQVGPRRSHPVPMRLRDLPELSAVLISHDHYDHLDTATIDALVRSQSAPFLVPLGVGAHLRAWGVPEKRIVELDWDDSHVISRAGRPDLTAVCSEARHFSGRGVVSNLTLWASWAMYAGEGADHRAVFFGGDSGYTPAFAGIGERYGPFDLTVLPIGAYDKRWADMHMNPSEAVRTHLEVGGDILLPAHWATFDLAFHTWSEPIEWLVREAAEHGVRVATPRPGERFTAAGELPAERWWASVARPADRAVTTSS